MPISEGLLNEFDHETKTTRRVLERIPTDKFAWAPHARSMPMGKLAWHVAQMATWVPGTLEQDFIDLSVPGPVWVGSGQRRSLRPAGYAIGAPTLRPALPASQHLHLMKFRVHAMKIDRRGGVILGSRESHTGASVPWPRRKR